MDKDLTEHIDVDLERYEETFRAALKWDIDGKQWHATTSEGICVLTQCHDDDSPITHWTARIEWHDGAIIHAPRDFVGKAGIHDSFFEAQEWFQEQLFAKIGVRT